MITYYFYMLINKYYHNSSFDLYITISNIHNGGLGIFTRSFIPKDSLIDEYCGELKIGIYGGEYYFSITNLIGINALNYPRCYMAMINDSKGSVFYNNTYFKINSTDLVIEVWSIKDINKNEELFIDYGSEYWIK